MEYSVLLSTFALLFLAEMGDKTQLMAMTLAHRHPVAPVIVGSFAAFVLLNLLAVLVGEGLSQLFPRQLVLVVSGFLFLFFAYRSWNSVDDSAHDLLADEHKKVWIISFSLIFVAETGDKTQLAMVALAAQSGAPWSVFVGGTVALWLVSLLGILVGRTLLRRIPARLVHRAAALLFAVFGLIALAGALLTGMRG